jgi:hypothetical protein
MNKITIKENNIILGVSCMRNWIIETKPGVVKGVFVATSILAL